MCIDKDAGNCTFKSALTLKFQSFSILGMSVPQIMNTDLHGSFELPV